MGRFFITLGCDNFEQKMKIAKMILFVSAALALVVVGYFAAAFADSFAAAQSVESPAEGLYTFTYSGDYGFSEFIERGGASSAEEMAGYITEFLTHGFVKAQPVAAEFGCSAATVAAADGGFWTVRNFDWEGDSDMVVMRTVPNDGYASVAASNIEFLGFGEGYAPRSMMERMMLLAAIYVPLDGMNEKGLCVADLIVGDGQTTNQMTEKLDLTTTSAIRLLLDRAADVEEAIGLLEGCDMHSDIGRAHHLAISDSNGRSVVVEWIDDEMVVTESAVCTNHYLAGARARDVAAMEDSFVRYDSMAEAIGSSGRMGAEQVEKMIKMVVRDGTRWSAIFDRSRMEVRYYLGGDFAAPYSFAIGR